MWQLEFDRHRLDWQTTEWVGISGPSGCGKTQLLTHLVTGHNARLGCEGENLHALHPRQRGIGWAAQGGLVWPAQSVAQQVNQLAQIHQKQDWQSLANELGVTPLLGRDTQVLSGGERQRVALLCALICARRLLVLDEPVSALDDGATAQVLQAARTYCRHHHIPALLVSHRQRDFDSVCDSVYLWECGEQVSIESAHRRFTIQQPQQAAALWPLDLPVSAADGEVLVQGVALEAGALPPHCHRVVIPAHEVSVARQAPGPSSIANTLEGTVKSLSTIAANSVLVEIQWREQTLYALITPSAQQRLTLTLGDRVFAQFKAHAISAA
ncbi:ATP-binding cassette domain-containing protein [Gilvimarinus xylanilyticus]|uniref:ATP-binding cassette domain-containing protein n=1 Tax=Gilvimarinus xylanilyticus TaxID=2944139 RepID=A0A9X2I6M9_9GAMM|nr:ATP-binding cassette domain-containing protein [Gilvimarinus xylanilyticus]MCP8899822.1 ATP-binding cassette domain-containing protein [Gilvimarinus xylanilyticus]